MSWNRKHFILKLSKCRVFCFNIIIIRFTTSVITMHAILYTPSPFRHWETHCFRASFSWRKDLVFEKHFLILLTALISFPLIFTFFQHLKFISDFRFQESNAMKQAFNTYLSLTASFLGTAKNFNLWYTDKTLWYKTFEIVCQVSQHGWQFSQNVV